MKGNFDSPFFFYNRAKAAIRNGNISKLCAALFESRGKIEINEDGNVFMPGVRTADPEHFCRLPRGWDAEVKSLLAKKGKFF